MNTFQEEEKIMWHQQVLTLDVKYNSHRFKNNQSIGMLYIRRRNKILHDYEKLNNYNIRLLYVKIRTELLRKRYGCINSDSTTTIDPTTTTINNINAKPKINKKTTAECFAFAGVHHVFDQHKSSITCLKFANNDKSKLCCSSFDGTITICDVKNKPPIIIANLSGHKKGVTSIDWSISNDLIVSSSLDTTIRLWSINNYNKPICLRVVTDKFRCEILCCAFVPTNNNFVITGNSHGLLEILNISTGIYPRGGTVKIGGKILALACEESGGNLVWAGNDRGIITSLKLDVGSGGLSKLRRIDGIGGTAAITSLTWRAWLSRQSPSPTLLVSSACNTVSLYRVIDSQGSLGICRKYPIKHRQYLIRSTFCPQMSACLIASGSEDGSIHLLDTSREGQAAQVNRLQGHSAPILALAFNYDESHLATGDHDGLVIIWRN
ncbi:hypothetical protein HCN44_006968 [Aphidius gifuensis]|uniref:WD repeat-containing protein 13 n=1 Tax=Aphidius gifuensis TaxID=684658 RepID=A0A834XZR3_APHGI|nr:WD repeat-containing protein 13-like [Aphidius gifuensis]KAF7995861.1 hypothetical protein HCN44_006968 [Aphidius gifuensis]